MRRFAALPPFWKYVLSFASIGLVTTLFLFLRTPLETTLVALLYLIPLGLITAFLGLGPGISSALITFFTLNYFFIHPYYTLAIHRPADVFILVVFLVVAVVISQLVGRMQQSLEAATAREREATQLYELSTALTGLRDDHAIAQMVVNQVHAVTQAEYVKINIRGNWPFELGLPEGDLPSPPAEARIPIQGAREEIGEILLWRAEAPISNSEKRLLQTFASQASLAIERTWLSRAEARARVLEESDKLKTAILSSVSHELRTPLSTIKAAASSLRGNEVAWDSATRPELIAAIDDEADNLNMLVGNLLDMSRIESGALKPKREWNILGEIIGSVLVRLKRLTGEHRIHLDLPDNLPLIPADYVQIEQVFTNLISNSLKYAPPGSVIKIHAHVLGDWVHVQVSNQGPQVPREDLERIFDKFYRVTQADKITGTGLGLSICKGIVEAHGGRIWAENLPDGLSFNFTLPLLWDGARAPELPMDTETE
jgi:two-component system sensor histidine kinase KdpD